MDTSRGGSATRIMIVDDDQDDFIITGDYIRRIPGANIEIDWCYRYEEALEHMVSSGYHLYLVDYRLGAKSGVDLLQEAIAKGCEEPIILLTGKGNYHVDIQAMQLGAVDYLIKPELTVEKMERSIRYALERANSVKALRDNERKYRSIFEKSKDIVFLTDEMMEIKDINQAAEGLLGYTREELMQMNLCDLIVERQQRRLLTQSLQGAGDVTDWEVTLLGKRGDRKNCVLSATQEEDASGSVYVQGIIHDISNLKKAEKAALQAEKLAAAGRLVRTLAHEVRNPLNNITLSVEQMMQEPRDEMVEMYLSIIQRNGRRISDLITELLSTSRPTETTLVDSVLQQIVDEVIHAAIDRLTLKRIRLQLSYPEESVWLKADPEKLKIALLNIVINAIEAIGDAAGELIMLLTLHDDQALLSIADNGCGISEDDIGRLFEPYFTQKRNGMGLGLAFTLNIIQAHKGSIDVQSVLNKGTTFTISFPISRLGNSLSADGTMLGSGLAYGSTRV